LKKVKNFLLEEKINSKTSPKGWGGGVCPTNPPPILTPLPFGKFFFADANTWPIRQQLLTVALLLMPASLLSVVTLKIEWPAGISDKYV